MLRRAAAGMADKGIKGQLLRAGSGGLGVRIVSLFATLLSSVVLARVLGDDSYGLYVFALSVTALLALPVQVGIPILVIRETAGAEAARDWVALHSIRAWVLWVNVLFGLVIAAGVLLFTWVAGDHLTQDTRHVFWLAAVLILPVALTSTFGATLRGLRWVMSGLYPGEVLRPLLISAFVGASVYVWAKAPGPEVALLMNLIATLLVLGLLVLLVRHALPVESLGERARVFKTGPWLKSLIPLAMMSSLHMVNQNTDLVMLGFFRNSAEVGYYKIAVSGAGFVIFGLSAIQVVAMPYVSRFFTEQDHDRLQRLASVCAGVSVLLALPVIGIYLIWGRGLLGFVYGDTFAASWEPLLILSGAQLVNGFFGIVWPLLVMTGHERAGFRGLAIATVANVGLNAALIPGWGAVGAATATGISILIWNVLFWLAVRRYLNIDGSILGLLRRGRAKRTPST
jgi:O-antigen/teichoic acid export membrane protein